MGKNPAFQYYPSDWRSDPVWGCSLAARGLWHEMMDRMHESKQYGYLSANGKAIPDEQIARLCGTTLTEYQTLLGELYALGIPRRTASGILYSKRMVEDERKRSKWRKQQKKHRVASADVSAMSAPCQRVLHSSSSSSKQKTNTAQGRRGDHSPEEIRQIEANAKAKQAREQAEDAFYRESRAGRNAASEEIEAIRRLALAKTM